MADTTLYKRLKRMFSTGVIVRKVGDKKLKVADTAQIQSGISNAARDRYFRLYNASGYGTSLSMQYTLSMAYQQQRIMLFRDYDIMDSDSIIHSALDLYAEESTLKNENDVVLEIECDDENIKEILTNLYYDILNIEFTLYMWVRNICKYGDFFLFMEIAPEYGIINVLPLSVYDTIRIDGSDPENPYYFYFETRGMGGKSQKLESYEVAHFRLMGDSNFLPYGSCLTADMHIDTQRGSIPISQIVPGEKIWTFNTKTSEMELSTVLNTAASGKKKILKISTQNNFIEASFNHPILIFDGFKFTYCETENLKIGDLLVLNSYNSTNSSNDVLIKKEIYHDKTNKHTPPDPDTIPEFVDDEFAEFFGFMMGDGWINTFGPRVSFALGSDESQNERYIEILKKYSGREPYISSHGHGKSRTAVVYSKWLYCVLKNMGLYGNAKTKRIPSWVYQLSDDLKLAFVYGLHNAAGWEFDDQWAKHYCIELSNKELIYDLKKLLQQLKIKTSNPKKKRSAGIRTICGVECNASDSYILYYYLDGKQKTQTKKYNFVDSQEIILDPVRKIEYVGSEETYDIQVESSNSNFIANGIVVHNSMLEGSRRVFRQLILMEDAMLISRIMRAPEKRVFKIDVGNLEPKEIENYMTQLMNKNKKVPFIDESTGQYNLTYNMQNLLEDFYLPVRGSDTGTSIENLGGLEYNAIEDIEYLKGRMLASLKIPKTYLGFEEDLSGKLTLSQEDVRFARTIERIQRMVESELYKIGIVHLYSQGINDERLVDFKVKMTSPSTIYEQEKINLWKERTLLARDLKELHLFSTEYIYKNFYNLSENDIEEERDKIVEDAKRDFRFAQIEQGQSDPVKFGFPQEKSPEELMATQPGMGGGEFGDQQALPPGNNQQTPTEESAGPGRPNKGSTYGQDSHYAGRDPLGTWERYNLDPANVQKRKTKKKSPLSMESAQNQLERNEIIRSLDKKIQNLNENHESDYEVNNDDIEPTFMDESVILEDN